ncbi:hypothetical protein VQH23_04855 [Pararoseomonas sp. SCSIO 73927]|uniref:hypothetical protein n=1 Tax=Pararoseomonas sp. SCSIO 73927 TaxID=3114537 RepID=UPI0030D2F448
MSTTIAPTNGGGLSPAELKALTDGEGNFSVTTIQWQDAASAATGETASKPASTSAQPASSEPSSENAKLAKDLLREARETKDPELKAELIKSAIDLLNSPAPSDTGSAGGSSPTGGSSDSAPAGEPKKFEGDALKPYLSAEGGNVDEGKDGGWAVGDAPGRGQMVDGEINRGQSLTFTAPEEHADNAGGTVELGKLYKNGPDGDHVEKARVTFYDENGKVVDEKTVEGSADGNVSVSTDKNFARVEVSPEDDGAGNSHENSDFVLQSVSMNPAGGAAPAEGASPVASTGDSAKAAEVLDLLGKVAGMIPGLGPVAPEALDVLGNLVDLIGRGRTTAA